MSLMRHLWLAVVISAMVAFSGSLFISIWTAESYLSQHLERKNSDIANSLALSLTNLDKGKAMIDLQVAALFDTGYYQSISVSDSLGRVISRRSRENVEIDVPAWFVNLLHIESKPGVADISASRNKYGSVEVISNDQFAYQALWKQMRNLLYWFALGGLLIGFIAMFVLRTIGRSLDMVVEQAGAIGERRLKTIAEPKISELKSLARAMNTMVERIWRLFNEEAARIDELRLRVNYDQLTGLANRDYFLSFFKAHLTATETAQCGVLVMIRLSDLNQINLALGRLETDKLLREMGQIAIEFARQFEDALAGRSKAGEIAIMLTGQCDPGKIARQIEAIVEAHVLGKYPALPDVYHIAAIRFERASCLADILSGIDQALTVAEGQGPNSTFIPDNDAQTNIMPGEQWLTTIKKSLEEKRLKLAYFPVLSKSGEILHHEGMVRLQIETGKPLLAAGEFMPIVSHFDQAPLVDMEVIHLAIRHLSVNPGHVAINLSAASIADWTFRSELSKLLRRSPDLCSRLWIEVTEYGAFRNFDAFKDICFALKGMGCHVGVEQLGQRLAEINRITELGLDYVKLHSGLVEGIEENYGNQEFIKRFCEVVHTIGVQVIAVGVQSDAEWEMLKVLGVDAATGPVIGGENTPG